LNVGSPDDKIMKRNKFYVLKENRLAELPGSRKKFLNIFNDNAGLEEFIKQNSLSTTNERDLKLIWDHFQSLQNN
jgi:hypothetical protein